MSLKKALVVGGTSGIGHGIALALAKRGDVAVIVAGRSQERGEAIVRQLEQLHPNNQQQPQPHHRHAFQHVDAFDLASVKKLAAVKPDLLVMTQGMATVQGHTPTADGLDQKLQLHYFSRIHLARLVAPHMRPGGRIVTVLSAGVHGRYAHFDDDFELQRHYSVKNAADAAGFYTDAGWEALARQFPGTAFAHAAPGFVNTNWGTEFPWYLKGMVRGLQVFGRSLERCGEVLTNGFMNLPTPADEDSSGNNFFLLNPDGKVIDNGIKHTREERDVIWAKTLELLPDI